MVAASELGEKHGQVLSRNGRCDSASEVMLCLITFQPVCFVMKMLEELMPVKTTMACVRGDAHSEEIFRPRAAANDAHVKGVCSIKAFHMLSSRARRE